MQRPSIIPVVAATVLVLGSLSCWPSGHAVGSTPRESESITGAACGVERWDVKTGMDPDAHLVKQSAIVSTTVLQLRSIAAPWQPPLHRRVRPTETTVWAIDATLLRYKREMDSDYHLVVADAAGRTMIVEVAPPECISARSPFLPAIHAVRRAFTAQFHPTPFWQRVSVRVRIVGVGFFDVEHGQSGVAPNAIELHPVLGIWWSGLPSPSTGGTPATAMPAAPAAGRLVVRVAVTPNPTGPGTETTVAATTGAGATCTVAVRYPSGHGATSAALATSQRADAGGRVAWTWRLSARTLGTALATVHCVQGAREGSSTAAFAIQ